MALELITSSIAHIEKRTVELKESTGEVKNSSVWTAPVWKLGEMNLNGRIYTEKLAERLVRENKTTTAHDGHDDYKGEYDNVKAICKNPKIQNGCLWVDIEFTDKEYEKKIEELVKNGVQIGVSSYGYGETNRDGVIDSKSYICVRYLDFVEMPAGCVYLNKSEETEKEVVSAETNSNEREMATEKEVSNDFRNIINIL